MPGSPTTADIESDTRFMARAIRIADKGRYTTHPNPCVGCVIVQRGEIVGEGYHLLAGQGHAEANALSVAGDKARGATAYVTLEPCSFKGRTPSCARTLIEKGVARVVVATLDPDHRNSGAGIALMREAGLQVEVPFLESSAKQLIRGHIKRYSENKPFVRLKLAMSLDGKTALANGESQWITSTESRRDVQKLRAASAAIVTGIQTVIDDDPRLSVRADELSADRADLAANVPRPVYVLDSSLRVPRDAALLNQSGTVLVTTVNADPSLPVPCITLPKGRGGVDLAALMNELAAREHSEVLFECGSTLAGSLIADQLVDEIILYVAPKLMGAASLSLLRLPEIDRMADLFELDILDIRRIGKDFRVTATPV